MDESMFSILGESLIAESSEALAASQTSSQPFSPNLSESDHDMLLQKSVSQQTENNMTLEHLNSLKYNCKCACHLFRNGHLSEEMPCQACCLENADLSSSISEMVSQSRPSARTSRHCSNEYLPPGSTHSHKITTPPNSVVSENLSDEVIVLSHSGTPPYPPPPNLHSWHQLHRAPDWLWDWSSRPEMNPPKGWPMDPLDPNYEDDDILLRRILIPGLICSHIAVLLIGIYIGRRLKNP